MKLQFSYKVEHTKNQHGPCYIINIEPYGDTIPLFLGIRIPPLSSVDTVPLMTNLSIAALNLKQCAVSYELGSAFEFDDMVGFIEDEIEINITPAVVTLHSVED